MTAASRRRPLGTVVDGLMSTAVYSILYIIRGLCEYMHLGYTHGVPPRPGIGLAWARSRRSMSISGLRIFSLSANLWHPDIVRARGPARGHFTKADARTRELGVPWKTMRLHREPGIRRDTNGRIEAYVRAGGQLRFRRFPVPGQSARVNRSTSCTPAPSSPGDDVFGRYREPIMPASRRKRSTCQKRFLDMAPLDDRRPALGRAESGRKPS